MLANFPPQNPNGSRGGGAEAVVELNNEIAALASDEGVVLVDLFGGLNGTPTGSIGVDGLHPTDSGYTKIANIWYEAIRRVYEQSGTPGRRRPTAPRDCRRTTLRDCSLTRASVRGRVSSAQ